MIRRIFRYRVCRSHESLETASRGGDDSSHFSLQGLWGTKTWASLRGGGDSSHLSLRGVRGTQNSKGLRGGSHSSQFVVAKFVGPEDMERASWRM